MRKLNSKNEFIGVKRVMSIGEMSEFVVTDFAI
jgi:hypothetical protein